MNRHTCIVALASIVLIACGRDSTGPGARPSAAPAPVFDSQPGTHSLDLVALLGTGTGSVNVTPTAEDQGTFHVQGEVEVHGAAPNTTFLVQRAPDLLLDGNCTGPWISFPIPNPGPLVTLTTSPAGAGAAHFELAVGGAFVSGRQFNVRFRLIDDLANPTNVLQTSCYTVTVK